jgi:hypothetical protein
MKQAMALATRVESCDKESDGFGGKSDGNEGGRQLTTTRAMATVTAMTWVMATVTRLAGNKEGKGEGGKGNGDGDEGGGQRRGRRRQERWQRRQWWQASDGNGNKEGDGDGDKGG